LEVPSHHGFESAEAITLNAGGGTILTDAVAAATFGGTIGGSGSLTKSGAGVLLLIGAGMYTGGTTISNGALLIGNGGTSGSITGNGSTMASLLLIAVMR
jgi:autotransporter-associated beta strand protein